MKRRVANLVIAFAVSSILAACGNHSQADVNDKNISTEATKAVEITEMPESILTEAAEPTSVPTETPTPTIEPTVAPTLEPTATPTPEPTATPEPTVTPTMEPTATPEPTPTVEPTATPEPTPTPTVTPVPTSTPTPTATPKPTSTPTPKPTATPKSTATLVPTSDPTPTPHVHSYSSAVTTEANCQHSGVRTYTCSCGDTYTESIPQGEHTLIVIPGSWHMANKCRCGYILTCDADYNAHFDCGGYSSTQIIDSVNRWHCTTCGYEEEIHLN